MEIKVKGKLYHYLDEHFELANRIYYDYEKRLKLLLKNCIKKDFNKFNKYI